MTSYKHRLLVKENPWSTDPNAIYLGCFHCPKFVVIQRSSIVAMLTDGMVLEVSDSFQLWTVCNREHYNRVYPTWERPQGGWQHWCESEYMEGGLYGLANFYKFCPRGCGAKRPE